MSNHIKIQGTSPRIQYVADGKLNAYEFPFVIFNPSDINVYFNDKEQDLGTYTVAISKNTEGGEVSFETAPASGIIITIVRNLAIKRTTTFQEGGTLRAKVLNNEFDYQMACQQQIADSLNRSMVLPPYAVDTDVDLTLPTPSAGKAIVWNKDGTNLENSAVKINELESTLKGYKESAESSATIATEKATIASDKADIATQKAEVATTKATEVSNALSGKTNTNMDNLTADGKKQISNLSLPSDNLLTLSLGTAAATNTYTAPANGYLCFGGKSNGGTSGADATIYKNSAMAVGSSTYQNGHSVSLFYPIKKNETVNYFYVNFSNPYLRFIYAQGEV